MSAKRFVTDDGETVLFDATKMQRATSVHIVLSLAQVVMLVLAAVWITRREEAWKWWKTNVWLREDQARWVRSTERLNATAGHQWEGAQVDVYRPN